MTTCTHCNGTGCEDPDDFNTICIECAGRGVEPDTFETVIETCDTCSGTGIAGHPDCGPACVECVRGAITFRVPHAPRIAAAPAAWPAWCRDSIPF